MRSGRTQVLRRQANVARRARDYSLTMIVNPTTCLEPAIMFIGRMPIVLHVAVTVTLIGVPVVAVPTFVIDAAVAPLVIVTAYCGDVNPAAVIVFATAEVTEVFVELERIATRAPSRAAPCSVCLQ